MVDNRGVSPLGLCHPKYDVKNLKRAFNGATEIRFGWLDCFFNPEGNKNAREVLEEPKNKWCRVHIINGPGMNNNRTCSHEITYKESTASVVQKIQSGNAKFLNAFEKRTKIVANVTGPYRGDGLDLCVSPWLEHKPIPQGVFKKLADIVQNNIPNVRIVDNPVEGGFFPGYLHEKHGNVPDPHGLDIVDLDGTSWEATDMIKFGNRYANLRAVLAWNYGDNGNSKEGSFENPLVRTHWTGSRDMRVYGCWVRPDALVEKNTFNLDDSQGLTMHEASDGYKRDFLWKLGDNRNYAITLLPRFLNNVSIPKLVVKRNGQIIDTGKYRGRYTEDGTNRQIWDFTKHTDSFPDNCVMVARNHGWRLKLPQFRID